MPKILNRRLGTDRRFPLGQQVALALAIAATDLGSVFERLFRAHGLTHARYNVLRILVGAGDAGLPQTAIGERLMVPSPDVTRLIDHLVDAGWVERHRAERDRRVVLHHLTDDGRALVASLEDPLTAVHDALVGALGKRRAHDLVGTCERIVEAIEERRIGLPSEVGPSGKGEEDE